MKKKRFTERFPFLLPLRKFQRKVFFYLRMKFDSNTYAKKNLNNIFDYEVFTAKSKMINPDTGFNIEYQTNKVHNLKLVAKTMDKIVIEPNEVFSFWILAKNAKKFGEYKDGLVVVNDETITQKGGGLCQISNLLFWTFLHTPLEIIERHPHSAEVLPPQDGIPPGVDATIAEGWKDIKVKNTTDARYQIKYEFDDEAIYISIFCDQKLDVVHDIQSKNVKYVKEQNGIYRYNDIYRLSKIPDNDEIIHKELILKNKTEIKYEIDENLL